MAWSYFSSKRGQALGDAESAYSRGDYDEAARRLDELIGTRQAKHYLDDSDSDSDSEIKRAIGLRAEVERTRGDAAAAVYWLLKAGPDAGAEAIVFVANTELDGRAPRPGVIDYCIRGFRLLRPEEEDHAKRISNALRRWLRPTLSLRPRFEEWREHNQTISDGAFAPGWAFFHLALLAAAEEKWEQCCALSAKALGRDPSDGENLRLQALALTKLGQNCQARRLLRDAPLAVRHPGGCMLAAHLAALNGDGSDAIRKYCAVGEQADEAGDAFLSAFAEAVCLAGRDAEALSLLERIADKEAPRVRLLRATIAYNLGDAEGALQRFAELVRDPSGGAGACRQIVEIARIDPSRHGVPAALEAIPLEARGEGWRQAYGEAQVALGNYKTAEALFARDVDDRAIVSQLQFNQLRAVAAAGNAEAALHGLALCALDRLPARAVIGLAAFAVSVATGSRDSAAGIAALLLRIRAALEASVTGDGDERSTRPEDLDGLIAAACFQAGQYEAARSTASHLLHNDEARIIAALAAAALEDVQGADNALAGMSAGGDRQATAAAIVAAYRGDYAVARHVLTADTEAFAAVAFLSGSDGGFESGELSPYPAVNFLRGVQALEQGRSAAAANLLSAVPRGHTAFDPASRLIGWIRLQEARERIGRGDQDEGVRLLGEACAQWPDALAAIQSANVGAPPSAWLAVKANDRARIAQAFGDFTGLDTTSFHRSAVFHLSEGRRAAATHDYDAAVRMWTRAIGAIATVVADRRYVSGWLKRRPYEGFHADDLLGVVSAVYLRLFDYWSDQALSAGDRRKAQSIRALGDALAAEIDAASRLADVGGLSVAGGAGGALACGPIVVAELRLESALAKRLEAVAAAEPPEEHNGAFPQALSASEKLEVAFSPLRTAAILLRDRHYERALAAMPSLERAAHDDGAENGAATVGGLGRGQRHAGRLMLEIRLRLAEELAGRTPPDGGRLEGEWHEAFRLAAELHQADEAHEAIRSSALGAAAYHRDEGDPQDAVVVLEAAAAVIQDDDVEMNISTNMAIVGVRAANEDDDLSQAVARLRQAHERFANSFFVIKNLMLTLFELATRTTRKDFAEAAELYGEAARYGEAWLRQDHLNYEIRDIVDNARNKETMLRRLAGDGGGRPATRLDASPPSEPASADGPGEEAANASLSELMAAVRRNRAMGAEEGRGSEPHGADRTSGSAGHD